MKSLSILLLSFSFASILHVDGEEYSIIQSAIDDAQTGDTVLVYQGLYYENLDINKTITLSSLAMYDNLDTWYEFEFLTAQYEISNDNILNTIIDASQATDENFTSSIVVRSPEDECISPVIMGFTIRGGMGTMVIEEMENDDGETEEVDRMIGGGLFSYITNAEIHHNQFTNNGDPSVQNGGAVYAQTSAEDWGFDNRSSGRPRCEINEINVHDNFYRDNDAIYGNTFSNRTFTEEINFTNSLFDIYNCPEQSVTGVWVDIQSEAEPDYSGSGGDLCSITDDVWISPSGSDYTGDATQNNPIRTITYALEIIAPSNDNPIIIHLDSGTYSPSNTNESFPIVLVSNVSILGGINQFTILNAEQVSRVIMAENCINIEISNITISGGYSSVDNLMEGDGAGLYINSSNMILANLIIRDNIAENDGGALRIISSNLIMDSIIIEENQAQDDGAGLYLSLSHADMNNITVVNNQSSSNGGAIYMNNSNPIITNSDFNNNHCGNNGGAIYIKNSNPSIYNSVINNNISENDGGGLRIYDSNPRLINVLIYNNHSFDDGGAIYSSFSNPIFIHSTISQNISDADGGGFYLSSDSHPEIISSILWSNYPNSLYLNEGDELPRISYSNIDGGWIGEGNINVDPMFINSELEDYYLQPNSPCINMGKPDPWYGDIDMSLPDMGFSGGSFFTINYNQIDFGEIGDIASTSYFQIFNYREESIIIDSVRFNSNSFYTSSEFPIIIDIFDTGIIPIIALPEQMGFIVDTMTVYSQNIMEGATISTMVYGIDDENILSGNLNGQMSQADYRITGNISILENDVLIIEPGSKFLFDGPYSFTINGSMVAAGTINDSIIFEKYNDIDSVYWKGLYLNNQTENTIFNYVRISNAEKYEGGAIFMSSSNPTMNNLLISGNFSENHGGGIYLSYSQPIFNNVLIEYNTSFDNGGGIYSFYSNPVFNNVKLLNNYSQEDGGALYFNSSNIIFSDLLINDNIAYDDGGGYYSMNSEFTGKKLEIRNNQSEDNCGGLCITSSSNHYIENAVIAQNTAVESGGGIGVYNSNEVVIINITLVDNYSEVSGGGIYLENSNLFVGNSIVWNNLSENIYIDSELPSLNIFFSDFENGWDGESNIDYDPLFEDAENGIFTLVEASPCIDAGTAYFEIDSIGVIVNLDESEYIGSAPDMGAYEYNPLSIDKPVEILSIKYSLEYPYPNPFNPSTLISFSIPEKSQISIRVFDINGKLISTLLNEPMNSGHHQIEWNAEGYPSGVYFVKLNAGKFTQTKKLMLVK